MPTVVVATGNPGKLKEMQAYLGDLAWDLQLKPDALEVDETGITFLENARLKASEVAKALGQWAIADDSGLEVDALDGAPGLYSARYADTDQARIERVLRELEGQPNRGAQFVCALALARPNGTIALETLGICRGEILTDPKGDGGFGYDPIFYVPELGRSFAELSPTEKAIHSHRGVAFRQFMPDLKRLELS
ncbi:RdgB/HAM1 family non-canonical purine NTP pyrophosphatase [Phormidium sp. FACHB-1136]|uniref:RdgB/HAM1 family non-canonical purine NTP pyrophosphatase n=1 Tax=Phormidium sp. FACHB-1136 TaxID=2692848 RepID=UPI00168288CF|nr:RdgB/HAM1 family non-canonical purine NTP pyrophosphatase [Phormidium sp. FACHB-1136]MBD2424693.1 RdgB/HAM1 family non-canonical purine NTP pyrophosphatase [Phormidium sp. FACHB-1136]